MTLGKSFLHFGFNVAIVSSIGAMADHAAAQTCAAPAPLTPNTPQFINTCSGENLGFACLSKLEGPAGIAQMTLPYPVGELTVQSLTGGYDPALFLLRSECSSSAFCAWAVDSGIDVDTLDLAQVDSGDYFLVIAPAYPVTPSCGVVAVTVHLTPEQEALMLDGVFRAGIDAPPANP